MSDTAHVEHEPGGTPVKEIMIKNPISVLASTSTADAMHLMRDKRIGSLPVLQDGHLVGIITEADFFAIANDLLEDSIADGPQSVDEPSPSD